MEHATLQVAKRTVLGKEVKHLRKEGWIPAVLFGPNQASLPIQAEERELVRVLRQAGATALIDLEVEGERRLHTVLARDIQRDIMTSRLRHVDFYQVMLDRKVKTMPVLQIVGEAPVVEQKTGVLVQVLNHIEVECLPANLIDSIQVDVSGLRRVDHSITVADLTVPPGVTILADPGEVVVSVVAPRATLEEEAEAAAAAVAVEEVEPEDED